MRLYGYGVMGCRIGRHPPNPLRRGNYPARQLAVIPGIKIICAGLQLLRASEVGRVLFLIPRQPSTLNFESTLKSKFQLLFNKNSIYIKFNILIFSCLYIEINLIYLLFYSRPYPARMNVGLAVGRALAL